MEYYNVNLEWEPLGTTGRCDTRACPYPGSGIVLWDHWTGVVGKKFVCWLHFLVGASPFSMEYEDADTYLCIPRQRHKHGPKHRSVHTTSKLESQIWDHHRIRLFRRVGFSYKASVAKIASEAISEGRLTHYIDPVFNVFTELRRSLVYSMCGEKVMQSLTVGFDLKPTCEDCLRMHQMKVAQLPNVPLREVLKTAPKLEDRPPNFESLLLDGLLDNAAFENRRNWGERSGRTWNDPSQGVQRDRRLRWDRGGVNRKRG